MTRDELLRNRGQAAQEGTQFYLKEFCAGSSEYNVEKGVSNVLDRNPSVTGLVYTTEGSGASIVIPSENIKEFIQSFKEFEEGCSFDGNDLEDEEKEGYEDEREEFSDSDVSETTQNFRDIEDEGDDLSDEELESIVRNAKKILSSKRNVKQDVTKKRSERSGTKYGSWPNQRPTRKHRIQDRLDKPREARHDFPLGIESEPRRNKAIDSILAAASREQQRSGGDVSGQRVQYGPVTPPSADIGGTVALDPNGPSSLPTAQFEIENTTYNSSDFVMFDIDNSSVSFVIRKYKNGKMDLGEAFVYDKKKEDYSLPQSIDNTVPRGPRFYQFIFSQRIVPYVFDSYEDSLDLEESDQMQYEVEAVYMIPILSNPTEPLKLDLEEVYMLNGELRKIERAKIEGSGGINPVLVVRNGRLFLEDEKEQKSPLEVCFT